MTSHHKVTRTDMPVAGDRPAACDAVRICDVSLRDGFQSLFATRGRTADMVRIAEQMDAVGYWAVEVWGGATFDTMHRFLNEDPWERIRQLKRHFVKTPLACALRGQNLVGYRNYADDVVTAFIERAAVNGMDVFRIFDPLNDVENLRVAKEAVHAAGGHFQGCICYSVTEPRMGGSVYTLAYYLEKARILADMGADSICVKDTTGVMNPYDAFTLIAALKEAVSIPVHLHTHATTGLSSMAQLKAVEAGVDILDTCLAPFAHRTSHPAVEPLAAALLGTKRDTGLDLAAITAINGLVEEEILPKYRHYLVEDTLSVIDPAALVHQVPGAMDADIRRQLREMNAEDRLEEVYARIPLVRKDLGQPPLVTPISQMIGTQAVNNVLFDDATETYRMISAQVKDLCYGLYGQTPAPIDPDLQKKALVAYPGGERAIRQRPGDVLDAELPDVRVEVRGLAADIEDELLCALFPVTGKRFLRWKYEKEAAPEETRPRSLAEALKIHERILRLRRGDLQDTTEREVPDKSEHIRTFNVFVDDTHYEVGVDEVGGAPVIRYAATIPAGSAPAAGRPEAPHTPPPAREMAAPARKAEPVRALAPVSPLAEGDGTSLTAPMPGMIVSFRKKEGDTVKAGETVVILEAMKMENALPAPADGVIRSIQVKSGENVAKDAVLCVIG